MRKLHAPPGMPLIIAAAAVASLLCLIAAISAWNLEKDASLVVATIALVWATLILGLATLFLALVALNEIAENRAQNEKALAAAQSQHEAAIAAGLEQTNIAIEAAREQSAEERNQAILDAQRANTHSRLQLNEQIKAAQKQNQELIRASHRPLLAPATPLSIALANEKAINIRSANVGSGVATNVQAVLLPHKQLFFSAQYYGHAFLPMEVGASVPVVLDNVIMSHILSYDGHEIKGEPLYAPEYARGSGGMKYDPKYRLTYTYEDQFGSKHCAMYDLLTNSTWECVLIASEVPYHIDELDRYNSRTPPPIAASPQASDNGGESGADGQ